MKRILLLTALLMFLVSCADRFEIIDKPISFSRERIEMTKDYIENRYGLTPDNIEITPRIIVLHWTAVDSFDSCYAIFNREMLEGTRPDLASAGNVNVSIQFLVDRDGIVYRLMPENWMARHCIGINYYAVGAENVGGENNIDNLTGDQLEANIELVRYLKEKYPTIEYLIGHYEYTYFEGHPLWLELDSTYRTEKVDPGERFMTAVRDAVADLNLKGPEDIQKEIESASTN
jgi:N-acetyl-anhydromuramyl-L-alanine amidase AmpD